MIIDIIKKSICQIIFCIIGILICYFGETILIYNAKNYDILMYTAALCFSFAFSVGSLRFPIPSLLVAIGVSLLIPRVNCGMSTGTLPSSSIGLSWILGSLAHLIIRGFKQGKTSIPSISER
jgi:hypothetical protein